MLFSLVFGLASAETDQGSPLVSRFTIQSETYPQNFSLIQASDNLLYIATYDGVAIYDRERWQRVELPKREVATVLTEAPDGRILVGSYNSFGYLEQSASGKTQFVDLSPRFAAELKERQFETIYDIVVTTQGYYFGGSTDLFFFDPETQTVRHWYHENGFGGITIHQQQLWMYWYQEGLKHLHEGEFELVPGSEALADVFVSWMMTIDQDRLLIQSESEVLKIFASGEVTDLDLGSDFPFADTFSAQLRIESSLYALGSPSGDVYVVDVDNASFQRFKLADENIQSLSLDQHGGGIFVLTDTELIRLEWPGRWRLYDGRHGLAGTIGNVIQDADRVLIASSSGLFTSDSNPPVRFRRTDVTPYEAWDIVQTPEAIIFADIFYFYTLDGETPTKLSEDSVGPRMLTVSKFDSSVVYFGTDDGFGVIRSTSDKTEITSHFKPGGLYVSGMVEIAPGHLIISTLGNGLHEYTLNADMSAIEERRIYTQNDGLEYIRREDTMLSNFDERVIVTTDAGLFELRQGKIEPLELNGLSAIVDTRDETIFEQSPDGTIWAFGYNEVAFGRPETGWHKALIGDYKKGSIDSVTFGPDGTVWIGANGQLFQHQGKASPPPSVNSNVLMRSVSIERQSGTSDLLDLDRTTSIPGGSFTITFDFALPWFHGQKKPHYQTRLTSFESNWSEWSELATAKYSTLPPGEYQFQVRAMTSNAYTSGITEYRFEVKPLWYQSDTIRGLLLLITILLGALASAVFLRLRLHQLKSKNRMLDELVKHRTAELEAANYKLQNLADSDGLTGIANRRRLDRALEVLWARCMSASLPLSIIMLDLDHFKDFNDQHGHLAGDRLLKKLGRVLTQATPDHGICGRFGGEEFIVLLPGEDKPDTTQLAETIRIQVKEALQLTASFGVATVFPSRIGNPQTLISEADKRLYEAKIQGRDQVVT